MLRRPVLAKGLDTRRRLKALAAVVVLVKESILEEWKNRRMNELMNEYVCMTTIVPQYKPKDIVFGWNCVVLCARVPNNQ